VKDKAAIWVFEAIEHAAERFPFPILGIDSDNGSEFVSAHLLAYCGERKITLTRSRPGNKNDGSHVATIALWLGHDDVRTLCPRIDCAVTLHVTCADFLSIAQVVLARAHKPSVKIGDRQSSPRATHCETVERLRIGGHLRGRLLMGNSRQIRPAFCRRVRTTRQNADQRTDTTSLLSPGQQ
jgi:hypothetical protein